MLQRRSPDIRGPFRAVDIQCPQIECRTIFKIASVFWTLSCHVHDIKHPYYRPGSSSKHYFCRPGISSICPYATARQHSQQRMNPSLLETSVRNLVKCNDQPGQSRGNGSQTQVYTVHHTFKHVSNRHQEEMCDAMVWIPYTR